MVQTCPTRQKPNDPSAVLLRCSLPQGGCEDSNHAVRKLARCPRAVQRLCGVRGSLCAHCAGVHFERL